jgi:hypothetical protein
MQALPPPLPHYVAAVNRHDVDAMLGAFSKTATVRDEGKTHVGHQSIHAWIEETTRKYRLTVDVSGVEETDDGLRVAMRVSGNFPGSPATLHYNFSLNDGLITRLDVGA